MSYYYPSQYTPRRPQESYKQKLEVLKRMIVEYVHENAALVDELEEVQTNIVIRQEERKFLLRKLCEYEPHVALDVQNLARGNLPVPALNTSLNESNKNNSNKRKRTTPERSTNSRPRRPSVKTKKKFVQLIALDMEGRPIFPIELGSLTIHYLGEVIPDTIEFHSEDVIYPLGFVSTRIYGSLRDPTQKCLYTCKISEVDDQPRFEIGSDDGYRPIIGDTPDVCHSLLLQKINDALSLNVVSTRPRGNEFFGLTHPTVLNLLQSSPATKRCVNYKWTKFEVLRNGEINNEFNDAGLNFDYLQRSINMCKYKMAPDVLQKPMDLN